MTDTAGLETTFAGDINATLETLKNADGSPYIIGGEMSSELSQAGFIGTLTTETAAGAASVSLNAALAIDYSNMVLPTIDYPSNGDDAATVTYTLKDGIETALVAGKTAQLSSITLAADVESGVSSIFQFQQHAENAQLFAPTFILWTDFGDIWMNSANYMEVPFEAPGASGTYSVTQTLVVIESDFDMEIDSFATETNYPVYSATLEIDTELMGIDDGQVKVSATNTGNDSSSGSALFSYGNRSIKLDADTASLVSKDQTFITLSNGDVSLKLVAECATAKNDEGIHDIEAIAACDGDLNFKGDVYIDGADEKVAVVEDRDGLPVIKFISGDSYGVVMTPNFDFVKQP